MTYYYNLLKTGQERGKAMRKAQLSLLKGVGYDEEQKNKATEQDAPYSHPHYWASFIQSGDRKVLQIKQ